MTTEPPAAPSSYVPGAAPVPLSQLSISQLRQLASSHGAPATGTRAELEAACTRRGVTAAAPRDIANQSAAPAAGGTLIAQFETAEGERTGPQLDVPADTTAPQLQLILNELLGNEDRVPYAFYVAEEEVSGTLGEALGSASAEQTLRVVYVPQAVFRVRAVTRCTSTLSGHSEAILSAQFSADGRTLATGSGDCCVRLWDVMTETPRATLKAPAAESRLRRRPSSSGALRAPPLPLQAHRDWVLAVAWSPCGKYIASGGKDGRVALWLAAEPSYPIKAHPLHPPPPPPPPPPHLTSLSPPHHALLAPRTRHDALPHTRPPSSSASPPAGRRSSTRTRSGSTPSHGSRTTRLAPPAAGDQPTPPRGPHTLRTGTARDRSEIGRE